MVETTRLHIGEVSALTGILPGRIRHYEAQGLIVPGHLDSGYRTFATEDVLRLLHIDLLRSLGLGLRDIRASLTGQPAGLRQVLEWHRRALVNQHQKLEGLIAAVDAALAQPDGDPSTAIERLAVEHRQTFGAFGRLDRPLSVTAADEYQRLLENWDLPMPGLFSQMVLPEPITVLLERLANTPGHEDLFERLRSLAQRVFEIAAAGDEQAADDLASAWVTEQLANPPATAVVEVLAEAAPRLLDLPIMKHGFTVWAESLSPLAARVLCSIESAAKARSATVLGAIVLP